MSRFSEFLIKHWPLFLALFTLIVTLLAVELRRRLSGLHDLGPLEATRMINHQNAVILDIRNDGEYHQGHLHEAVHIPLGDLSRRMTELEKYRERPIITYCSSGSRSARAASLLLKQGFTQVYNLRGGVMAWQSASLPLQKKK